MTSNHSDLTSNSIQMINFDVKSLRFQYRSIFKASKTVKPLMRFYCKSTVILKYHKNRSFHDARCKASAANKAAGTNLQEALTSPAFIFLDWADNVT